MDSQMIFSIGSLIVPLLEGYGTAPRVKLW